MTVTEVLDYVRRLHNEASAQVPFWTDAELYAIIQAKCNKILSIIGLIEGLDISQTTVANQQAYNYPTDFIRIRRIRVAGQALKYINFRQFEARTPQGVAPTGTPREWTTWNNVIYMMPTPSASSLEIDIYGEKQQSAISSASSTINLPVVFHQALCDAVIEEMFLKDLNEAMASYYKAERMQVHTPAMLKFAARRRRVGGPTVINDTDSSIETEFGVK